MHFKMSSAICLNFDQSNDINGLRKCKEKSNKFMYHKTLAITALPVPWSLIAWRYKMVVTYSNSFPIYAIVYLSIFSVVIIYVKLC